MSIPEVSEIRNTKIPYESRLLIAVKLRDFTDAVTLQSSMESSIEVFNNNNLDKEPDRVGVTLFYPNKEAMTHLSTKIFNLNIGEVEFGRQVQLMESELLQKAGAS
jgi:hypothetical protein